MPFINYSRAKTYRRCAKAFEYKYLRNLQRKKPPVPLLRGTIIHEMLDIRATNSMLGPKVAPKRTPAMVLAEYAKKFKSLFIEEREMYGETFIEDIDRVFKGYERQYATEPLKYEASEEGVQTDLTKDIRFVGTIDKRVLTSNDGRHWLLDHKTHKSIPGEEARFSDLQLVFYLWAWNRENPSRKVDGIIWDYLRTKPPRIPEQLKNGSLSQRENMDTDVHTYLAEIRRLQLNPEHYKAMLETLRQRSTDRFYLRVKLPAPSAALIDHVVEDMRATAIMINRLPVFPRNMGPNCVWCEYFRVCSAEVRGLDHEFIEKSEYEEREADDYESSEED